MAKLPIEESETIWTLKRQLLEIINTATAAEDALFSNHGETELTVAVLDELKRVSERAAPWFSRLSNLQVRIAESQPDIAFDMLDLLNRSIIQVQIEVPALERSIQEVKQDWNLS
jgi:3-methyladenine DNA glycosylase/8-oxoguanine DNA glycosylase